MKRLLIVCIIGLILVGCNKNTESINAKDKDKIEDYSDMSTASHAIIFNDLNELSQVTPIIIRAKVMHEGKKVEYGTATFVTNTLELIEVYRDEYKELDQNDEITLLQTLVDIDPLVKKDEEVLLYLMKYEGPVVEQAFVINGLEQGHFKVEKEKIVHAADKQMQIFQTDHGELLNDIIGMMDKNQYKPIKIEPVSEEEIKKQNKKESEKR